MTLLWFVNAAILLAFVKVFETPPLIPVLVRDLGIDYAQAGMFMTAYALVRCLGSSPGGYLSDRHGAMPVIAVSLAGVGVCGLLGTVGSNYEFLLALRILVSFGVAVIFIAVLDAIAKYLPPAQVGAGVGYVNVSLNVGITAALLLTPILAEAIGWRWTSRVYSLAVLLLAVLALPILRSLPPKQVHAPAAPGASSTFMALLRNPFVMLLALATALVFIEMYGVLTWVPAYLENGHAFTPAAVGLSSMMFGLAAIPASLLTGYACTTRGRILWLCLSGGALCGVGILALLNVPELTPWTAAGLITLLTWGHTQIIVAIMCLPSLLVPPESSGRTLGLVFTFGYAGAIVSTYLGGHLVTLTGNYRASFLVFAVFVVLAAGTMAVLCRLLRLRPPPQFTLPA